MRNVMRTLLWVLTIPLLAFLFIVTPIPNRILAFDSPDDQYTLVFVIAQPLVIGPGQGSDDLVTPVLFRRGDVFPRIVMDETTLLYSARDDNTITWYKDYVRFFGPHGIDFEEGEYIDGVECERRCLVQKPFGEQD